MPEKANLNSLIREAFAAPHMRVRALTTAAGDRYWLKVAERPNIVRRLQKGNARRALEAEERALDRLYELGLPVAQIVARGPEYIVLPDVGPTLDKMLRDRDVDPAERVCAFAAAGAGLARFHQAGYAHGRPAIRDVCWRDGAITFIDFERFRDKQRSEMVRALDVLLFIHSWFTRRVDAGPELEAAIATYKANVDPALWSAVLRWRAILRPVAFAASGLARFRTRSRDLKAPARMAAWMNTLG